MIRGIARMTSRKSGVVIVVAVALIMILSSVSLSALFYPNDYDHNQQ